MNSEYRKCDLLDRQLYHSLKGNFKEADEIIFKLLKERPYDLKVKYNLSFTFLRNGDIQTGMRLLNIGRFTNIFKDPQIDKTIPLYHKNINDKIVLIYLEGGYGDCFIGLKFAKEISKNNKVKVITPESMKSLVDKQPYIYKSYINYDKSITCDCWLPSMSSENVLQYKNFNEIPRDKHIFIEEHNIIENSIGIKFTGSNEFEHNKYRSPQPQQIINILEPLKNKYTFFSLEKNDDIKLPKWIKKLDINNWLDTAVNISKMDKIISTCTGVAHLSASMNKNTLIIIPILPFWIWAYQRKTKNNIEKSWYYSDNTSLFRQKKFNNWEQPLKNIINMIN